MNKTLFTALALVAAGGAGILRANVAQAGVVQGTPYIGVQFQGGGGTTYQLTPGQSAGVVPQDNYNPVSQTSQTATALNDATGAASGVTLTTVNNNSYGSGTATATANATLLEGESKANNGSTGTYTFNNVPTGTYDLIAYIVDDNVNPGNYTLGVTTYYVTEQAGASGGGTPYYTGSFVQASNTSATGTRDAGNYVEFYNVSPTGGALTLTDIAGPNAGFPVAINGFQLLNASTAVPEPATLGIVALGGLAILAKKRRKVA